MKDWTEEDWQHFEDALRTREPWELSEELRLPPPNPAPLRELAIRIDAERGEARALLEPLLDSPAKFDAAKVETDPAFQTRSMVGLLTSAAASLYERQPRFALAAATAAVTIGTKLAAVHELSAPALLGLARVERGKVLFLIGRYREAEEELRLAEEAFDADPHATEWEHARASLVRANLYVETHRFPEALADATFAARAFQLFGDTSRLLAARMVEGGVRFMQRDYPAAAQVLDALIGEALRLDDRLHLGRALQTAGNCYIELGKHDRAASYLDEALRLWDELGLETERVRTNWSIGVLLLAKGEVEEAIERIDEARRAFEGLGLVNDAAIARLELAEALLVAGRPDEVPDLLRNVVVRFTSAGMMGNARIALAYLREAVEAGAVEPGMIRHVRHYLEELPVHPASAFTPPQ